MKTCSQPGCDAKHASKGYCKTHYMRFFNAGSRACDVEGCSVLPDRRVNGFCAAHQPAIDEKRCPQCDTVKPRSAFAKDSRTPTGLRCYCKSCHADSNRVPCPTCEGQKSRRAAQCGSCAWTKRGPEAANWRGGRTYTAEGYVHVQDPDHPGATTRGYVKEHRLVMEKMLGRYLVSGESVHHKNGVKDDNRPENLELWVGVGSQPKGQRVEDLVVWAREILERYDTAPAKEFSEITAAT